MNLQDIYNLLKANFEHAKYTNKIDIYKNQVVYLEVKANDLFFALDVNKEMDVFLIFRNRQSQQSLCDYFNCFISEKTQIYSNEKILVGFLSDIKGGIVDVLKQLINQLLRCLQDSNYLLGNINSIIFNQSKIAESNNFDSICLDMGNTFSHKILSLRETLIKIKEQKLSIARFGDGEIRCMVTTGGCVFQKHDWKLMQELRDISRDNTGLLVCYPSLLIEDGFWRSFWSNFWPKTKFYLQQNCLGDAMITRPEAFYFYGQEMVHLWMALWEGKKVCFITGENSRLNAEHTIFSNISNAEYIFSKNRNAYNDIDHIFKQCLEKSYIDIFLIALGPTGTALASRLHKKGLRSLDIGHLNNSYDTVFLNQLRPENIAI